MGLLCLLITIVIIVNMLKKLRNVSFWAANFMSVITGTSRAANTYYAHFTDEKTKTSRSQAQEHKDGQQVLEPGSPAPQFTCVMPNGCFQVSIARGVCHKCRPQTHPRPTGGEPELGGQASQTPRALLCK